MQTNEITTITGRAYDTMAAAAITALQQKDCAAIAENADVDYDSTTQTLEVASLGRTFRVTLPDYAFDSIFGNWHGLVLLHYLDMADNTPLTGTWIPFEAMEGGMVRGAKFEQTVDTRLGKWLTQVGEKAAKQACLVLGGTEAPKGNADWCVLLPFLPRYPILLKLWFADEEFDASAKMLFDASASHYLTVEDAVTLGEVVMDLLEGQQATK